MSFKYWKTKYFAILSVFIIAIMAQLSACNKNEKAVEDIYAFKVPEGWPQPAYNFEGNEVSKEKFELGKALFYDVQLSITNTVSCGTCHQPFSAFAQLDHDVSHGVYDRIGKRNSQPLFNLNWHNSFFWDGRVNHIEVQPLNPITDTTEMGETLQGIIAKLQADPRYDKLFTDAFGDTMVNSQRIFRSMAVFMGLMVSDNSKYDKFTRGEVNLTEQEQRGLNIFEQNCASCHKPPLFSDFSFRSNGLPDRLSAHGTIDSGRAAVAPYDPLNMYKFKVPSLRNLAYTRPYMHDGRFATLERVLDHYANIDPTLVNLDPLLQNGIALNSSERSDLLAFLNTLNDEVFVKDKRFIEN